MVGASILTVQTLTLMFQTLAGSCGKFAPFEIKENMVLAPLSRVALDPDYLEQLDKLLHAQNTELSFLRELKHRKPRKTGPTLVNDSSDSVNRSVWGVCFASGFIK